MTTVETELAEARMLLSKLASGAMTMRVNRADVTRREIAIPKREMWN
ncbi:MAG: hypothetical protein WAR76_12730 [Xanthobacteraceae bacterium]|jgi:hypothetical protein